MGHRRTDWEGLGLEHLCYDKGRFGKQGSSSGGFRRLYIFFFGALDCYCISPQLFRGSREWDTTEGIVTSFTCLSAVRVSPTVMNDLAQLKCSSCLSVYSSGLEAPQMAVGV